MICYLSVSYTLGDTATTAHIFTLWVEGGLPWDHRHPGHSKSCNGVTFVQMKIFVFPWGKIYYLIYSFGIEDFVHGGVIVEMSSLFVHLRVEVCFVHPRSVHTVLHKLVMRLPVIGITVFMFMRCFRAIGTTEHGVIINGATAQGESVVLLHYIGEITS